MSRDKFGTGGLARIILRWIYRRRNHHPFIGDMEELYSDKYQVEGQQKARFWLWWQLILSLPHLWLDNFRWRGGMLRNYLLTGMRNLSKQKIFSLINISGLAFMVPGPGCWQGLKYYRAVHAGTKQSAKG